MDRRIDQIARSFDFLLAITPINAEAARQEFRSSRFAAAPRLLYRPLTVEVDVEKRRLFSIPFANLEDPLLYDLYRQKQQELDLMLTMIAARDTPVSRGLACALWLRGAGVARASPKDPVPTAGRGDPIGEGAPAGQRRLRGAYRMARGMIGLSRQGRAFAPASRFATTCRRG